MRRVSQPVLTTMIFPGTLKSGNHANTPMVVSVISNLNFFVSWFLAIYENLIARHPVAMTSNERLLINWCHGALYHGLLEWLFRLLPFELVDFVLLAMANRLQVFRLVPAVWCALALVWVQGSKIRIVHPISLTDSFIILLVPTSYTFRLPLLHAGSLDQLWENSAQRLSPKSSPVSITSKRVANSRQRHFLTGSSSLTFATSIQNGGSRSRNRSRGGGVDKHPSWYCLWRRKAYSSSFSDVQKDLQRDHHPLHQSFYYGD